MRKRREGSDPADAADTRGRPDLSGSWRYDPERSTLEIDAPESGVFVIVHRDPAFRLSRTFTGGGRRDDFSIALTTDGEERPARRGELELRVRSWWEGDALVFAADVGGGQASNVVRYRLAEGGRVLHADERFESDALRYHNLWVLVRD